MAINPCSTDREIFHALLDKLLDAQKQDPDKTMAYWETISIDSHERRCFRLSVWKKIEPDSL